jgi:hypothetical protein
LDVGSRFLTRILATFRPCGHPAEAQGKDGERENYPDLGGQAHADLTGHRVTSATAATFAYPGHAALSRAEQRDRMRGVPQGATARPPHDAMDI